MVCDAGRRVVENSLPFDPSVVFVCVTVLAAVYFHLPPRTTDSAPSIDGLPEVWSSHRFSNFGSVVWVRSKMTRRSDPPALSGLKYTIWRVKFLTLAVLKLSVYVAPSPL